MLSTIKTRQGIASRLKHAREKAGYLSAEDFCEKHHLPATSYTVCEQGKRAIKFTQAACYCKLLNIPLRWLLLGEGKIMPG